MNVTRFFTLLPLLACLAGPAVAAPKKPPTTQPKKKRLLVITESRGFVHGVVRRGKKGEPALVEKILREIGEKSGDFDVVCSQDSRKDLTPDNLKNFDAVFFYTTGNLPLSDAQKAGLLQFVRKGGGFSGSHSATDTFYAWPDYGKLIGGYFDGHPWHEKVKVNVEDGKHPATRHLGKSFTITDEIYQFRAPYDRDHLHVLMTLDKGADGGRLTIGGKPVKGSSEVEFTVKGGVPSLTVDGKKADPAGFRWQGLRGKRKDRDNALAWTHEYGKGRVFYTALGHRDEVWKDERFQKHMLGGLRYVLRIEDADATPSGKSK